jgi:hypothetical protein
MCLRQSLRALGCAYALVLVISLVESPLSTHVHGAQCACASQSAPSRRSLLAALLPALSCAVCPACLALWKPLLSIVGVTLAFNDEQHAWLLYGSLAIALGVASWDLRRSGVQLPFWLTAVGGALMVFSHLAGEVPVVEWTGVLVMAASVPARMRLRAQHHAHWLATS